MNELKLFETVKFHTSKTETAFYNDNVWII